MDAVKKVILSEEDDAPQEDKKQMSCEVVSLQDKRQKRKFRKKAVKKLKRREELKLYQTELIRLLDYLESTGKRLIVVCEGRDTAGKGGAIKRILEFLNPKHARTIALPKPSDRELKEIFIQRYMQHMPALGEIALFDRSWYNRAMVEPVLGFCSKDQYKKFMSDVLLFEQLLTSDENTILVKLYFSIKQDTQAERLDARAQKPHKNWKLSEADKQAQEKWAPFTKHKHRMLKKTHTDEHPWTIIRSDKRHLSRLEAMKVILNSVPGFQRDVLLDYSLNSHIVFDGESEWRYMESRKEELGISDV